MFNNDSLQLSDITNPYTAVRDYPIYGSQKVQPWIKIQGEKFDRWKFGKFANHYFVTC